MSRPRPDAGLRAVARVREVRERDSRMGVQHALDELRHREADLAQRREDLAAAEHFVAGDLAEFAADRMARHARAAAVERALRRVEAGRTLASVAQEQWADDRTRLRAVELLLERRAAARRADRDRAEARELDDVAARLWLREQAKEPAGHERQIL